MSLRSLLLIALGAFLLFTVWTVFTTSTSGGRAWPFGIDLVTVLGLYGVMVGGVWVIRIGRDGST